MLVQVTYDTTVGANALKLFIDGLQRATYPNALELMDDLVALEIGNGAGAPGGYQYDQFLTSDRTDLDCWDLIAGSCSSPAWHWCC